MGIFDEIEAAQGDKQTSIRCRLCMVLNDLDDDERNEVQKALDNSNIYGTTIAEVLNKRYGISPPLQGASVQRHRRGAHS